MNFSETLEMKEWIELHNQFTAMEIYVAIQRLQLDDGLPKTF
jgi:hypothetical protein